ncbi:hypothetical protein [Ruminococcus sp. 5_1_39BFAA]
MRSNWLWGYLALMISRKGPRKNGSPEPEMAMRKLEKALSLAEASSFF